MARLPSPCPVAGAAEGTGVALFAAPGVDVPGDWMPVAGRFNEGAEAAGAVCPYVVPPSRGLVWVCCCASTVVASEDTKRSDPNRLTIEWCDEDW